MSALRSHATARLLAGSPVFLVGRLLTDRDSHGREVAIDPSTGGELSQSDPRPAWVISTEGEATDGDILRQFWDFSRVEAGICPILFNHDKDEFLGQVQDAQVIDDGKGRRAVARGAFGETETALELLPEIRAGRLPGVSVRWKSGAKVRRSELDPTDPWYKPASEDECGMPGEGYVLGSAEDRNVLFELSVVTMPADPAALSYSRAVEDGYRAIGEMARGVEPTASAFANALLALRDNPEIAAYLARRDARLRESILAEVRGAPAAQPKPRTLTTMFPKDT